MSRIFLVLIFIMGSFFDMKNKQLPRWFLGCGAAISFGLFLWEKPVGIWEMLVGVSIGFILLLIGKVTREALGYGDGILLGLTGIQMGVGTIGVLSYGLILSAMVSLALLAVGKVNRKTTIPFVPFLGLGYGIYLLGQVNIG